jgi:N,N-dimethylformamidase
MTLVGYSDSLSVRPGDTLEFKVTCDGAEAYEAALVRLIHGDTNPDGPGFKEEVVETVGSFPGRTQEVHSGSYVRVDDGGALDVEAPSVAAFLYATTPAKGEQAIVARWSNADRAGYALVIDAEGRLALWIGDGAGGFEAIAYDRPLTARNWYFVAASVGADGAVRLEQRPVASQSSRVIVAEPEGADEFVKEASTAVRAATGHDVPLTIGAWTERVEGGKIIAGGHLNGKVDRPVVATRALAEDEVARGAGGDGVLAAWDFAAEITPQGIKRPSGVTDRGPKGLQGRCVNHPTRGVKGFNWTSEEQNFVHAPEQYAAIHFHDDDLEDAGWDVDFSVTLPDELPSGVYAARLTAGDEEDHVPFYVRARKGQEKKIAFLVPTASYMAYANDHVTTNAAMAELMVARTPVMEEADLFLAEHREYGLSTYDTHSDGSGSAHSSRLRPIVNMRPKYRHWLSPSLWQFNADLHLVDWMTQLGYEFDVLTDEDMHLEGVAALAPYNVVLTGSHPEYYSTEMLDALADYQAQGGRLMYMGANGFYWVIQYDPENPAMIEVRKCHGSNAWKAEPGERHLSYTGEYGTLWRDRGRAPQKICGTGFVAEGFDISSYYRRRPDSYDERAAWIFEGIDDEILGDFGLVGDGAAGLELDIFDPQLGTPDHTLLLASSERHTDIYLEVVEELFFNVPGVGGTQNPRVRADMVYYTTPNGGAVFSTSSIAFCGSLSHNGYDNNISRLIKNVLDRFAADEPLPAIAEAAVA